MAAALAYRRSSVAAAVRSHAHVNRHLARTAHAADVPNIQAAGIPGPQASDVMSYLARRGAAAGAKASRSRSWRETFREAEVW
jgi:hypothetical protein